MAYGLLRREMMIALGRDGEVDHHDAVLLDDADQQDHADHCDEAEVETEQHQRRDGARARRWQRRENSQRMDVALIENAQDQIDDE